MRLLIIPFVTIILSAANLFAQHSERGYTIYADLGFGWSVGPESFDNGWSFGPTYGLELDYEFSQYFYPGFFVDFSRFDLSEDNLLRELDLIDSAGVSISGGDARVIAYGFSARLFLFDRRTKTRPYLSVGLGTAKLDGTDLYLTQNGISEKIGEWGGGEFKDALMLGAGVETSLKEYFSLFADIKYTNVSTYVRYTEFTLIRIGFAFY